MPKPEVIRARVFRLIDEHAPVARRVLEHKFAASTREAAKQIISELLADSTIAVTGIGKRGSPETIVKAVNWPQGRCPLCGKE
jgi:hypothetical protein